MSTKLHTGPGVSFDEGAGAVVSTDELLISDAADRLMVSRRFLNGLLRDGVIPFRETESGVRIRVKDIDDYDQSIREKRRKLLAEIDAEIED